MEVRATACFDYSGTDTDDGPTLRLEVSGREDEVNAFLVERVSAVRAAWTHSSTGATVWVERYDDSVVAMLVELRLEGILIGDVPECIDINCNIFD